MALTIAQTFQHAQAFLKVASNVGSAEEVRMANTVQSLITGYYRWHWAISAGTNISLVQGTQDYNLAAGDQNRVQSIVQANLLSGSTEEPELWTASNDPPLPRYSTQGRPLAVALISPTQVRFYPVPDAAYTFQWRYHARPIVFTANTESFQIPEAFTDVSKTGMVWQLMEFLDDDRAEKWRQAFFAILENHKRVERMTTERMKV